MLAEAQILADPFQGRWDHGIPASEAFAACKQVQALERTPTHLVAEGLPEAIAASQSAIDRTAARAIMLVVDVGAGTSDIGAFIVQPTAKGWLWRRLPAP